MKMLAPLSLKYHRPQANVAAIVLLHRGPRLLGAREKSKYRAGMAVHCTTLDRLRVFTSSNVPRLRTIPLCFAHGLGKPVRVRGMD